MPTLTDKQIAGAVKAAGWPSSEWTTAVAVILGESSGRSDVRNSIGASGLMQILQSAHQSLFQQYDWRDPVQNCKMGLIVWQQAGRSWGPWVAYTSGSYRAFLARAKTATGDPTTPPGGTGGGSTGNVSPVGVGSLTNPNIWLRIAFFIGGAIALFIAVDNVIRVDKYIPVGRALTIARQVVK